MILLHNHSLFKNNLLKFKMFIFYAQRPHLILLYLVLKPEKKPYCHSIALWVPSENFLCTNHIRRKISFSRFTPWIPVTQLCCWRCACSAIELEKFGILLNLYEMKRSPSLEVLTLYKWGEPLVSSASWPKTSILQ